MRQQFEDLEDRVDTMDEDELDTESEDIVVQRAQIEQTRAEMSDTIEAIKEKLSPQQLAQQAKESVKEAAAGAVQQAKETVGGAVNQAKEAVGEAVHTAREKMDDAVDTARDAVSPWMAIIRENPVPATMAAIGIGWLWMSARNQRSGQYHFQPRRFRYESFPRPASELSIEERSYPYGASVASEEAGAAGTAEMRALPAGRSVAGRVAEQAQEKVHQAKEKAHEVAGQVQETASHLGARAQEGVHRAADRFQETLWENPLAVGVVAAAIGMAIGFVVPETRHENRIMGEARDRLVEKAQETAQDVVEKVQTVASEAVDTAREEARRQGLATEDLTRPGFTADEMDEAEETVGAGGVTGSDRTMG